MTFVWWLSLMVVGAMTHTAAPDIRATAAPPPTAATANPTATRRALLDSLWTRQALRGEPSDAQVTRLRAPDRAPPDLHAAQPLPPRGPEDYTSIRSARLPAGTKAVALTFDLCETSGQVAGYDAAVVNYLRDHQVAATFFAGGKWMRSHPEKTMQLMADPLFELGDHSWSHLNLRQQPSDVQDQEIDWPLAEYAVLRDELVRRARERNVAEVDIDRIPRAPRLFRFPFGTCSAEALHRVADAGLRTVQWDVLTGDPTPNQTAAGIVRTVLRAVKPGSIVIMHANGRGHGTAEALPELVPALRRRGFEFVTVSDLLAQAVGLDTAAECYELRPGDTRKYDRVPGVTRSTPQPASH